MESFVGADAMLAGHEPGKISVGGTPGSKEGATPATTDPRFMDSQAALDALRSEGDINLSPRRQTWAGEHLDASARKIVAEDADLFLHQSLSSP